VSFARTLCNTIYWLALTVWIAILVAAGVAAASTFAILPDLGVSLAPFAAYPEAEHGRIAAGHVMEPVFAFVDVVQFGAAPVVLLMVLLQHLVFRVPSRRVLAGLRVVAIAGAAALLAYRALALAPEMNRDLRIYWEAAEAGDVVRAEEHRARFDAAHPTASRLISSTLGLLVIALLASPATLAPVRGAEPDRPRLQEPDLARSRP
jgi:hypothetical protein